LYVLGVSAIPSSIAAVPADVIKKRLILGHHDSSDLNHRHSNSHNSVTATIRSIYRTGGAREFFLGWKANLSKDVLFSAVKMSLYEGWARVYLSVKNRSSGKYAVGTAADLNGYEAAGAGMVSGVATAVLTCPIDCVNTRIKSGEEIIQMDCCDMLIVYHLLLSIHHLSIYVSIYSYHTC
jgi:hypothetical protein